MANDSIDIDRYWMSHALKLAKQAANAGEVPVGAILVLENRLIGQAWNQPIQSCDPTAHAEILALRQGALKLGNYRLINTTLYVTLEPCMMCIGALVHARVKRLVFGAFDLKVKEPTAKGGIIDLLQNERLNHQLVVQGGILAEACAMILQDFFRARR